MNEADNTNFRSGIIGLVGLANAGKSTLINQLSGYHLAITSPKPQTTRHLIRAVVERPDAQLIFWDTPGFFRSRSQLDRHLAKSIQTALYESDVVLLLTDARAASLAKKDKLPALETTLLETIARLGKKVILVLNKIDRVEKQLLLHLIERYRHHYDFSAIIPVSAKTGDGIEILLAELIEHLPIGPRYLEEGEFTDQTERTLAGELIREQVLRQTEDEIPHGVAVLIESFLEKGAPTRQMVIIGAVIYCDKESHKKIIIGKQGARLKAIGSAARAGIEEMLDCKCYLDLFVKVREDWRNKQDVLRTLGFGAKQDGDG